MIRMSSRNHLIRLMLLVVVLAALPLPGRAQDQETGVSIRLTIENAEGEREGVEGVTMVALDDSGAMIAEATSDAEGAVFIPLPEPGTYTIEVQTDTLPEGIEPRDPDRAGLEVDLQEGEVQPLLFPLVGEGGAESGGGPSPFTIQALRLVVDGVKFGLIIAMSSIGLSLIYGTTRLVNFAHGELVTFGALMALAFNHPNVSALPMVIAGAIAIVLGGVFGYLNDKLIWAPLRRRGTGLIAQMVITIGLSIFLQYVFLYQAGGDTQRMTQFSLQTSGLELGPVTIVAREMWIIGISLVVLLTVALAIGRTRTGKAIRAVSDNRDLAESSGIAVQRVIRTIWIAGGALAALAGVLFGLDQGVAWNMGNELLLLIFAAVIVGGIGTAYGSLVGSLIVGLFVYMSTLWIAPELRNLSAMVVLIVVLMVRPQGLFGQKERIG